MLSQLIRTVLYMRARLVPLEKLSKSDKRWADSEILWAKQGS